MLGALTHAWAVEETNWLTMRVSLASSPPITMWSPSGNAIAPPPLAATGRPTIRDQRREAGSKQSTRLVVGERPPATQAAPAPTNPIRWFRGCGRVPTTVQALRAGSYDSTGPTLPAALLPPIAYSLPPVAISAWPPRAKCREASAVQWFASSRNSLALSAPLLWPPAR